MIDSNNDDGNGNEHYSSDNFYPDNSNTWPRQRFQANNSLVIDVNEHEDVPETPADAKSFFETMFSIPTPSNTTASIHANGVGNNEIPDTNTEVVHSGNEAVANVNVSSSLQTNQVNGLPVVASIPSSAVHHLSTQQHEYQQNMQPRPISAPPAREQGLENKMQQQHHLHVQPANFSESLSATYHGETAISQLHQQQHMKSSFNTIGLNQRRPNSTSALLSTSVSSPHGLQQVHLGAESLNSSQNPIYLKESSTMNIPPGMGIQRPSSAFDEPSQRNSSFIMGTNSERTMQAVAGAHLQRPASTGLIGLQRPAPKVVMDLIQEENSPTPNSVSNYAASHPSGNLRRNQQGHEDVYQHFSDGPAPTVNGTRIQYVAADHQNSATPFSLQNSDNHSKMESSQAQLHIPSSHHPGAVYNTQTMHHPMTASPHMIHQQVQLQYPSIPNGTALYYNPPVAAADHHVYVNAQAAAASQYYAAMPFSHHGTSVQGAPGQRLVAVSGSQGSLQPEYTLVTLSQHQGNGVGVSQNPLPYWSDPIHAAQHTGININNVNHLGQQQQYMSQHKGGKGRMNQSQSFSRGGRKGAGGKRGGDQSGKGNKFSTGPSSLMLEEFRTTNNRAWTINDIKGHIVGFCKDQNGSRFIQQRLEVADTSEKEQVMSEVRSCIRDLRDDVFGNYVVQKLFEKATEEIKNELTTTLFGEIRILSLKMYGCRVVQTALETLDDQTVMRLIDEFKGEVVSCIHDQNGNHVIQKCVEVLSVKEKQGCEAASERMEFILNEVLESTRDISCHPYGCRVLQRILEHCEISQRSRALEEISSCHRDLLDDQYGNYVVQHVLQFGRESDRESILGLVIKGGLLTLSRQKFASNVVEKLLKYGSPVQRNKVVLEMLKTSEGSESSIVLLMVRDAYANYVVQTTLDVISEGNEKNLLMKELQENVDQLRNYTFAKHIVTKLGVA